MHMKWVRTRLNDTCGAGKHVYGRCMSLSPHTLIESLGLSIVVPYQRRLTLIRLFSYNSSIYTTGPGKGSVYIWESYLVLEVLQYKIPREISVFNDISASRWVYSGRSSDNFHIYCKSFSPNSVNGSGNYWLGNLREIIFNGRGSPITLTQANSSEMTIEKKPCDTCN